MRVSIGILFLLTGCATVNFSANYYVPPQNYRAEIEGLWREFVSAVPLKYAYNFHKYAYQNYYADRFVILSSLVAHEICHADFKRSKETA